MVSLHGLAGDPISYMDKYAGQVEEFMKLCFPNVRGRGRPMQGRTSPKSPVSPTQAGRRGSQSSVQNRRNTMSQSDLIATLQQHQQQAAFHPFRNLRFNPLQSIFPGVLANNNNNSILAANKHVSGVNNFLIKQEEKELTPVATVEDIKSITTPPSPVAL
uniref:Uncharacterized protein n=1 Tax=Caenorhabditis japonica TaxID=281687 RepID=A0A8R1ITF2_CAEJA